MRSRFTCCVWALFVAASSFPFGDATAQTYAVVDFATVIGGSSAAPTATAISPNGSVTGYTVSSGVVFDGVSLTYLPCECESYGYGINASGQVTGALDPMPGNGQFAFLFSGGSMMNLGALGGDTSIGYAINDNGQITGQSSVGGNTFSHAFLYSNGKMTDLGTLPGGTASQGNAINDSGVVVGGSVTAQNDSHAFLTQGGRLLDLGTLAGGTTGVGYTSNASGINNAGEIVGSSDVLPSGHHAFLYSGGKMTDLGTLGGNSRAWGINSSGQIVGDYGDGGGAFLYSNGVMTDLLSLIDPSDPLVGKLQISAAIGINDSGWILAEGGDFTNPANITLTPFLLIPFRFSPRSLTFSSQAVGTQSAPQPITLTNLATSPLTITQITPTSGFAQTNDCPASLANGSSCTIQVAFSPSFSGSQSGVLKITTALTTFTLPVALSGSAPGNTPPPPPPSGGGGGGGSIESLTLAALLGSLMAKLLGPRQRHWRFNRWGR